MIKRLFFLLCSLHMFIVSARCQNMCDSVESVATKYAKNYYSTLMVGKEIRDLTVSVRGMTELVIDKQSHQCVQILVTFQLFEKGKLESTHYKNWFWDLSMAKCYCYSDIKPEGEPYVGFLTSVCYFDVSDTSFAITMFPYLENCYK